MTATLSKSATRPRIPDPTVCRNSRSSWIGLARPFCAFSPSRPFLRTLCAHCFVVRARFASRPARDDFLANCLLLPPATIRGAAALASPGKERGKRRWGPGPPPIAILFIGRLRPQQASSGQCETLIVGVYGFARITSVAFRVACSPSVTLSKPVHPRSGGGGGNRTRVQNASGLPELRPCRALCGPLATNTSLRHIRCSAR